MPETKKLVLIFTMLFGGLFASAQATPQTARQALLEMFFSKTPGTFEKHLPQATRAALRKAGTNSGASMLTGFSALTGQLSARGQQLQTFEAGPTLMLIEDPVAHSKFEITVERDDLRGDEDEIELAFHGSKDGETQTAGAKFRLTLTMKQEAGSWRLNEISATIGVSLSDPEFLKAMTKNMRPATTAVSAPIPMGGAAAPAAMNLMTAAIAANEASAVAGVRTLNTAEITYVASFPGHGFTCTLVRSRWHGKRCRAVGAAGDVDRSALSQWQKERICLLGQWVQWNSGVALQRNRRACGSEFWNTRFLQR